MKGTLVVGPTMYVTDEGKIVVFSAGAMYPDISGEALAVIEEKFEAVWPAVRAAQAAAKKR